MVRSTSPSFGLRSTNGRSSRTASMNSSVMQMPWCRLRLLRLKSPEGLRISMNSSISGWCTSRYTAAEPRRSEPCEIASVSESMTRTKGMMPEVWPQPLTVSPMERTPPQ